MAHPPADPLQAVLDEAWRMLEENAPLDQIVDRVWFAFAFHTETPFHRDGLIPFVARLYETHKGAGGRDAVAHCMLLLGRAFSARGEFMPACRFYKVARNTFQSEYGIIAMEFFREELRSDGGKAQVGMSKADFEAKYAGDTPEALVLEYCPAEA
jgi:hypothetical protein